ncbi:hypothetical protein GCM10011533_10780 [Streptosporangium jomthongense]|uniref:Uncharacterized protein n=1 Tax=Marinobacter aromaticivorans TaxID=1494078 RepID=A0ABW2ISG1_9GAMM|nr:hypothetical protein [Marinobacter aromaticivorans]GGE60040.1 hypothetical protein GCM10011533_10780 [Streptosporangium jomthongense]
MKAICRSILFATLPLLCIPAAQAQDSGIVTIEGTRIRGDQEVPMVMYLVPWQPPEVDELRAPDEQLMVEQPFAPLERYEFQRLVRYHEVFNSHQVAVTPDSK